MNSTLPEADLGFVISFSVVVVINLLGNGLVCLVVFRFHGMRAPVNYLLVNLSVSDMMVALFIIPDYIVNCAFRHPEGDIGDYFCIWLTGGNLIWVGMAASTSSLVVMSFERYFAVIYPLDKRWRLTNRRLAISTITGWLYAIIFNLPLFFVVRHQDGKVHCTEVWSNHETLREMYALGCLFGFGLIPMAIIVYVYFRILLKLWKGRGVRATLISDQKRIRAIRKVTKMAVVVTIVYGVCRLPNLVLYALQPFESTYDYDSPSYISTVLLVGLNSAMNPFIYALHSANFRHHIKLALRCSQFRPADYVPVPP
ncbi:allatostatin-A receptor-like [Stylophora pistillata]|uniref:allatostatin-A receptor-like n=1 Tax=Stylophora pistillata TaxID=50429 RepID=UPI000C04D5C6|nr:allatostatin-A receptor-like [Stylophora pistillata]